MQTHMWFYMAQRWPYQSWSLVAGHWRCKCFYGGTENQNEYKLSEAKENITHRPHPKWFTKVSVFPPFLSLKFFFSVGSGMHDLQWRELQGTHGPHRKRQGVPEVGSAGATQTCFPPKKVRGYIFIGGEICLSPPSGPIMMVPLDGLSGSAKWRWWLVAEMRLHLPFVQVRVQMHINSFVFTYLIMVSFLRHTYIEVSMELGVWVFARGLRTLFKDNSNRRPDHRHGGQTCWATDRPLLVRLCTTSMVCAFVTEHLCSVWGSH